MQVRSASVVLTVEAAAVSARALAVLVQSASVVLSASVLLALVPVNAQSVVSIIVPQFLPWYSTVYS